MKKLPLIAIFILAVSLSFVGVTFAASKHSKPMNCHGICIALREDKAAPDTVTVVNGTYVQFNSADGNSHEIALGEGGHEHHHLGKFESGVFKGDEAYRIKFTKDGAYYFHDHLNPKINILIVVYTPGKDYSIK